MTLLFWRPQPEAGVSSSLHRSTRRFNRFVSVSPRLHGGTRGTVRGRLTATTECYDISKVKLEWARSFLARRLWRSSRLTSVSSPGDLSETARAARLKWQPGSEIKTGALQLFFPPSYRGSALVASGYLDVYSHKRDVWPGVMSLLLLQVWLKWRERCCRWKCW